MSAPSRDERKQTLDVLRRRAEARIDENTIRLRRRPYVTRGRRPPGISDKTFTTLTTLATVVGIALVIGYAFLLGPFQTVGSAFAFVLGIVLPVSLLGLMIFLALRRAREARRATEAHAAALANLQNIPPPPLENDPLDTPEDVGTNLPEETQMSELPRDVTWSDVTTASIGGLPTRTIDDVITEFWFRTEELRHRTNRDIVEWTRLKDRESVDRELGGVRFHEWRGGRKYKDIVNLVVANDCGWGPRDCNGYSVYSWKRRHGPKLIFTTGQAQDREANIESMITFLGEAISRLRALANEGKLHNQFPTEWMGPSLMQMVLAKLRGSKR